jgi:hypothetical protein
MSRNILIAPCGNQSVLFKDSWLKYSNEKQFDICLLFYHEQIEQPPLYKAVDYFFHLKHFKYHMIHELLTAIHPEWLAQYDYFYFPDDDIEMDTRQINALFHLSHAHDTWISQASLTADSFCSWPFFKTRKGSFCRYVGQIEVMAPLFNSDSLIQCLPTFQLNKSSWGLDAVWSKILQYPERNLVIFDAVAMKHTKRVGMGELYQIKGVDPYKDWVEITTAYQAKKDNLQEFGSLQLVNKEHHCLQFKRILLRLYIARKKQAIRDYDLLSRITNKKIFWFLKPR